MNKINCPICEYNCEPINVKLDGVVKLDGNVYSCKFVDDKVKFRIGNSYFEKSNKEVFALTLSILLKHSQMNSKEILDFYFGVTPPSNLIPILKIVNIEYEMKAYPRSNQALLDSCLLNLSRKYFDLGKNVMPINNHEHKLEDGMSLLFYNSDIDEVRNILKILTERGLLIHNPKPGYEYIYAISADGWSKISYLEKNEFDQAFIAMSFSEFQDEIFVSISKAVNKAGYDFCRMDQTQHNNYIVPEILYQIDRSKFVILEISEPNFGAYFEAGYALAKGKQVIVSCKKSIKNSEDKSKRPHFDIEQANMILWSDNDDLEERLMQRIIATIGSGTSGKLSH